MEITINPAFEEDKQNDGEHLCTNPHVAISKCSKVRSYSIIYLSWLSKNNLKFRFQICD